MAEKGEIGRGISIHPPRVGRDRLFLAIMQYANGISIHPPRVGRDAGVESDRRGLEISIHPPRVGRDSKSS